MVIAAHNEIDNLKNLIPELLKQEYPRFEIIVSLDRSTDGSGEYLAQHKNKISYIEIQSTPTGWDHKKFALSEGIKRAQGDWIVLTDADCLPYSTSWLRSISKEISPKTHLLIGVSPIRANDSIISKYAQFEGFMTYFLYTSLAILHRPYMAVGRNMAIRKSFWEEKKGYESIKGTKGGDDDLFIQLNASKQNTALFIGGKDSLSYTWPKESWSQYWMQKIRHYSVSSFYKRDSTLILSCFHLLHSSSIIGLGLLSTQSFFLPIILFYLFIKLAAYRFVASKVGTGFNYILFPVVDMLYAFMIPFLGVWSKLVKDIKWKN